MSYTITPVTERPNPKAASFEINADLLKSGNHALGDVAILTRTSVGHIPGTKKEKEGPLVRYSPLVTSVLKVATLFNRIDFSHIAPRQREPEKTLVTFFTSTQFLSEEQIPRIGELLRRFVNSDNAPILNVSELVKDVPPLTPFRPKNTIEKYLCETFHSVVDEQLARDGGAMKIVGLNFFSNGDIQTIAALFGSCSGCGSSTTKTLANATKAMQSAVSEIQKNNPDHRDIQRLNFRPIEIEKERSETLIFAR